jgi:hypothetical protein
MRQARIVGEFLVALAIAGASALRRIVASIKTGRLALIAPLAVLLAVIAVAPSFGDNGEKSVAIPATANIFGAGLSSPPDPAGHGAGTTPPFIALPKGKGRVLVVSAISGKITCCDTEKPPPYAGWGGDTGSGTDLYPVGSIGGVHGPTRMFLVGVFLRSSRPGGAAPVGDSNRTPEIAQPFAIRPGSDVVVPDSATRLFLGFGDGYAFAGDAGYYSDNAGTLRMTYKVTVTPQICPKTEVPTEGKAIQVGNVIEIKSKDPSDAGITAAYVRHGAGAPLERLSEGDVIRKGDIVSTNPNTVLAFEFATGGRVGVSTEATIKVVNERTIVDVRGPINLTKANLWTKCAKLKEPLEIQTNGGIMGDKG